MIKSISNSVRCCYVHLCSESPKAGRIEYEVCFGSTDVRQCVIHTKRSAFSGILPVFIGNVFCAANVSVGGRCVTYRLKRKATKCYKNLARIYVFSFKK